MRALTTAIAYLNQVEELSLDFPEWGTLCRLAWRILPCVCVCVQSCTTDATDQNFCRSAKLLDGLSRGPRPCPQGLSINTNGHTCIQQWNDLDSCQPDFSASVCSFPYQWTQTETCKHRPYTRRKDRTIKIIQRTLADHQALRYSAGGRRGRGWNYLFLSACSSAFQLLSLPLEISLLPTASNTKVRLYYITLGSFPSQFL
jgi:hypothetical protein